VDSKCRSKGKGRGISVLLFIHASSWGQLLMLINYLQSLKGVSPELNHYDWYRQMGMVVVLLCIVLIRTKE